MSQVISDLLTLSGFSRKDMDLIIVLLIDLVQEFITVLKESNSENETEIIIMPGITAKADEGLARILIENLLRKAWKFSSKTARASLGFSMTNSTGSGPSAYLIRDNWVGFDMALAGHIFEPFKRLHSQKEFP